MIVISMIGWIAIIGTIFWLGALLILWITFVKSGEDDEKNKF